jgi:hypothetical protein
MDLMLTRISRNQAPTDTPPTRSVRNCGIFAAGAPNKVIRPRDIEGSYSRKSKNITLDVCGFFDLVEIASV